MHDDCFDAWTQALWQDQTRRQVLRRLAGLPLLSALGTVLTDPDEGAAQGPVRRIQHRTDKSRQHRRRREEHRRDRQRRDHGQDDRHAPGSPNMCSGAKPYWIAQACGLIAGDCCPGMTCTASATVAIATCQFSCQTDQECGDFFSSGFDFLVRCKKDLLACPFLPDATCCQLTFCFSDADCPTDYTCKGTWCARS